MVKPVDLQDNLSKTQLLERVHQLQKSTPEEAQKQFAQELQKRVAEGKERVVDTPKADEIIIHRDEKREKEKEQQAKKDTNQDKDENASSEEVKRDENDQDRRIDYIA